jgi:hypothetical protein
VDGATVMDHWNRVRHYRELAAQALEKAENTADETERATYFHMAAAWHQLAQEGENIARSIDALNALASGAQIDESGAPPLIRAAH